MFKDYHRRQALIKSNLDRARTVTERMEIMEHYDREGSFWDRSPPFIRVMIIAGFALYFGGGLIAPFFWTF